VPLAAKDLNFLVPRLDFRMLCFDALVSIATGLLFGLAPALESSRRDLGARIEGRRTAPVSRSRLRSLLTVSEIALSLVLADRGGAPGAAATSTCAPRRWGSFPRMSC